MIKSFAKVNIFLKITNRNSNGYHQILSRFVKVRNLYDEISFDKKSSTNGKLTINGNFDCDIKQNTIYKAYTYLYEHTKSTKLKNFFTHYQINVKKNIPSSAGLGGGSSNCANFLTYINKMLNLKVSQKELCSIGQKIGSDIVFFIKNFDSANVSGEGEIVKLYEEELLDIQVFTPNINCSTQKVYQEYKNSNTQFFDNKNSQLQKQTSKEILKNYNIKFLNDLYKPAKILYPKLKNYEKDNNFFSGSGSSFFS